MLPVDPFGDHPPIWRQVDKWNWLADQRKPTKEIFQPALSLPDGAPPVINAHVFRMGSQKALHGMGEWVAEMIESECRFRGLDAWEKNKKVIPRLFFLFFPINEGVGWYSLNTARMPAPVRSKLSGVASITQDKTEVSMGLNPREFEEATLLREDEKAFARPPESVGERSRPALLSVPRKMYSDAFPELSRPYREQWICMARKHVDEGHLRFGRMPAALSDYRRSVGGMGLVRDTAMLTLAKVDALLWCESRVIEFHPKEGSVISVRKLLPQPLGLAISSCAPVEHKAVNRTLIGRLQ